jgi:hypothetical protein
MGIRQRFRGYVVRTLISFLVLVAKEVSSGTGQTMYSWIT